MRSKALLVLVALVACLVVTSSAARAESCGEAADRLARDNGVLPEQPGSALDPGIAGSSHPPTTTESPGAAPKQRPAPRASDPTAASAPPLTASRRAQLRTLLDEARQAEESGRVFECEETLRRAQALLPPG